MNPDPDWWRDYRCEAGELAAQEDEDDQRRRDEDRRWSGAVDEKPEPA